MCVHGHANACSQMKRSRSQLDAAGFTPNRGPRRPRKAPFDGSFDIKKQFVSCVQSSNLLPIHKANPTPTNFSYRVFREE